MEKIHIQDNSGDKNYFTIVPNYILNHSSIWDREVYIQMKKITGEEGTCWTSQKKLSQQCGISVNRLKKSIKYLIEHKWIEKIGIKQVETMGGQQEVNEYKIVDLWKLNTDFYINKYNKGVSPNDIPNNKGVSPNEQRGITENAKGYHQKATNKNPLNNIPFNNNPLWRDLINYYFELKGWNNKEKSFYKENKIIYARFTRPAKELLELCENNAEEAKNCLKKVGDWAKSRDLDWSIETVFKKWYDIDILKPKEKKPYIDGLKAFQKVEGGKWYVISKDGEIREYGATPKEIIYK